MPTLRRLSLSAWILIGLGLGLCTGLFFGDYATALQPIADIYVRLMQMTVLPYLVLALVIGFGQLERDQASRLAWRGGAILLVTWAVTYTIIRLMPLAFPTIENASFFSSSLVEPRQPFSIAETFFTSNPFHSLTNAIVPAVVLFSSALGIGLITVSHRERLLEPLRVINTAVVAVTAFVIRLTPVGVFAIGAVTAGTMTLETLQRLEVYFVVFGVAALVLAFVALPLLVTALTPFRYREVVSIARDALLTAFVANSAFIVLPILIERSKVLLERHGLLDSESDAAAEILIPVLFNFPNAGKLLPLLFIPFAAWLSGVPMSSTDYATLAGAGIPALFAKSQVALPFLLDLFELPHDLFQLYIPTSVVTGKFDSMVTAMNLLAFALLGAGAMSGFLVVRRRRLVAAGATVLVVAVGSAALTRVLLHATVDTTYHRDRTLREMRPRESSGAVIVHRERAPLAAPAGPPAEALSRARARTTLRIGYDALNVPFGFVNAHGELVGLDVELGTNLARSLGLTPEFVPVSWPELGTMLDRGEIDVMPGMWVRPFWFGVLRLSQPYLTGTVGLIVRDERRDEFSDADGLRHRRGLTIGVPLDASQLSVSIERYFDREATTFMPFESAGRYFEHPRDDIDGFLMPAEGGAAITLLHPEYTVVVPQPHPVKLPYAFGVARGADDLADAINEWVVFAESEGLVARAYDYWVLGRGAAVSGPRWSVLRNVLGWQPQ